jgi:hypothetical protein
MIPQENLESLPTYGSRKGNNYKKMSFLIGKYISKTRFILYNQY